MTKDEAEMWVMRAMLEGKGTALFPYGDDWMFWQGSMFTDRFYLSDRIPKGDTFIARDYDQAVEMLMTRKEPKYEKAQGTKDTSSDHLD